MKSLLNDETQKPEPKNFLKEIFFFWEILNRFNCAKQKVLPKLIVANCECLYIKKKSLVNFS